MNDFIPRLLFYIFFVLYMVFYMVHTGLKHAVLGDPAAGEADECPGVFKLPGGIVRRTARAGPFLRLSNQRAVFAHCAAFRLEICSPVRQV